MNPSVLIVVSFIASFSWPSERRSPRQRPPLLRLCGTLIGSSQAPFPVNSQLEPCLMDGPLAIGKSSRLIEPRARRMYLPK